MTQESAQHPITEHHIAVRRTARYHCIGRPGEHTRDIWFVLHGYGQLAGHFIRPFRDIASDERLVVAPEALSRYYSGAVDTESHAQARIGAVWMTREDRLAEIDDYVHYLDDLHRTIIAQCNHPDLSIRTLGFSQGTATASRWFALGSSKIDHLLLWGGAIAADLDMEQFRERCGGTRFTAVAGESDTTFSPIDAHRQELHLASQGITQETLLFPGGHTIDRNVLSALVLKK